MRFLSLFSGIEAASVAWCPLGWECVGVAEVEPFPCAVLKHRYPDVPNLGDINKITRQQIEALGHIDVIVLGFPCQDVSIAGNRQGFKNADGTLTRSGLFFVAMRIIEWSKARWTVGENVPGLFSSHEGRDFASVVGELSGAEIDVPRDGWRTAGVALGPLGLVEWFVLDAQYTRVASHLRAVPQRRRRVFIVRDTGDWQGRPPLFLVRESLRWNPPPRREARQRPAPTLAARTRGGGGLGTDFDLDGGQTAVECGPAGDEVRDLVAHSRDRVAPALDASYGRLQGTSGQDLNHGHGHLITETGDARSLLGKANSSHAEDQETYVTHSLTSEGFDASEDGTGRRVPLTTAFNARQDPIHSTGAALPLDTDGGSQAIAFRAAGQDGFTASDVSPPIAATDGGGAGAPTIAFSCKDNDRDATAECAPTLRGMGHDNSHANGGGQIAIALQDGRSLSKSQNGCGVNDDGAGYTIDTTGAQAVMTLAIRGREGGADIETREDGTSNAILTPSGGRAGMGAGAICTRMAVRRLTPTECARLQGFPGHYLDIIIRGKPAADGPKYRALGNSMAVNCMSWIGQRISEVSKIQTK